MLSTLPLTLALCIKPVVSPPSLYDQVLPQSTCGVETDYGYSDFYTYCQDSIETFHTEAEIPKDVYTSEPSYNDLRNDVGTFIAGYTETYIKGNTSTDDLLTDITKALWDAPVTFNAYDDQFNVYSADIYETEDSYIVDWSDNTYSALFTAAQEHTRDDMELHEQLHEYLENSGLSPVDDTTSVEEIKETAAQLHYDVSQMLDYEITNNSSLNETLKDGTGQCWHYASILTTLAKELNIPATIAQSNTHSWSILEIDGTPLAYDPTFESSNPPESPEDCQYIEMDPTEKQVHQGLQGVYRYISQVRSQMMSLNRPTGTYIPLKRPDES